MQTFIDTATQRVWAFDDDVKATTAGGAYSFSTAAGTPLSTPATLQPYVMPAPTPEQIAAQQWASYQARALAALDRSDVTMARVVEAVTLGYNTYGSADVVAYVNWRRALRSIVSAKAGTPAAALPAQPPYPAGT